MSADYGSEFRQVQFIWILAELKVWVYTSYSGNGEYVEVLWLGVMEKGMCVEWSLSAVKCINRLCAG